MKLPISCFINAYNENHNLKELFKSLNTIDDIVVIDHNSTDNTAKLAKGFGARVYTKPAITEKVTKYDVLEFKRRFGFEPSYKQGDKIINWAVEMNTTLNLLKHDWTLYIDCDERLKGDIDSIDLTGLDVIGCNLIRPKIDTILTKKLFRRSRVWFIEYTHSIVTGQSLKENITDKISIEHLQIENENRKNNVKDCEFGYIKSNSLKMNYMLAKEYFRIEEYERSFKLFRLFLENTNIALDRAKAYTLMSGCLWHINKKEEAYMHLFFAMREYPFYSKPFEMMANLIDNKEHALMWRELAAKAKVNDVL